ncbi:MAG: phosphoglycolate phosphatase [Alphaproteobacteria bacterium]|jgi:phosphoglycolate phosphatase
MTISQRLIVFDCDGTLVDSQHGTVSSMTIAFESEGLPAPRAHAVRRVVGLPLDAAIATLISAEGAPDMENPKLDGLVSAYAKDSDERRRVGADPEPLFPGVRDVLQRLQEDGYALGVATGKSRRGLLSTLDNHDLGGFFQTLKSADDGPGKPHPTILQDAMRETGVAPESTVMIGDTTFDIQMAVNAESLSIGVSWGYHDVEELTQTGADRIAQTFEDLPGLIDALWR